MPRILSVNSQTGLNCIRVLFNFLKIFFSKQKSCREMKMLLPLRSFKRFRDYDCYKRS